MQERSEAGLGPDLLAHEADVGEGEEDRHDRDERDDVRPDQEHALVEGEQRGDLLLRLLVLAERSQRARARRGPRVQQHDGRLRVERRRQQPVQEVRQLGCRQRVLVRAVGRDPDEEGDQQVDEEQRPLGSTEAERHGPILAGHGPFSHGTTRRAVESAAVGR